MYPAKTLVYSEAAEPAEAPEPTTAPEPTATPEEADLSLDSRATGLDQLKSYAANWTSEWETTKDGKTRQFTWNWLGEYTAEPEAQHYVWKSSEDGAERVGMEMWQIGDTMYMVTADSNGTTNCTSFSSSEPDSGLKKETFSPSMLGDMTIYKTASKPADVLAFYQKELAAAGWKPFGEPTSVEGLATMEFTRDGQRASITITSEGEGSQVLINVSQEE